MKLCPEMWLVSKSLSLSLSLTLSLIFFLPRHSLQTSSSKVICAGPVWHISARRAVKFFHQYFPSVFQTPIKYESILPEISPLFVWRYSTLHRVPLSIIVSPSHWHLTIPFVRRSTWSQIWLTDQHLFNHLHIRDRVRIHFSAAHPTCGSGLWGCWWGGSLDSFLGELGHEVSDSPCLIELASKKGSEHPSAGSEWQWDRVPGFGPLKPVSIWDHPPPSLDPLLAGQRPLSSKKETSRPAHVALTTWLREDKKRHFSNSWHLCTPQTSQQWN